MTRRFRLLWKLLLAVFLACTFASLLGWAVLLTKLCSNPRQPVPETQQMIAYNCHGMTVFMSPFEDALRHWLIPLGAVFTFLSVLAAAMVLLGSVKVRIDVQIHHVDASRGSPHREGE
jgi:Na+-transporting methylmalonyl-CoA/oxaloacetate decarboxylase gamma subunit